MGWAGKNILPIAQAQRGVGALYGLFVMVGVVVASWVTRTPALRDTLGASTEQMGLVLFGLSVGSMLGILSANAVTQRLHARRTIGVGMTLVLLGMAIVTLGAVQGSQWMAFAGFFSFGVGMGWADIAMNVECAALERHLDRTLMTTLHGCFSLGTLLGALLGMAMVHWGVSLGWHWLVVLIGSIAVTYPMVRVVPNLSAQGATASGAAAEGESAGQSSFLVAFKDRRVLLIGMFVLGMALAEGAANDWLPLLMVDGHGFAETEGSVIFLLFTVGMVIGRFSGHRLLQHFERSLLMRASALAAVLGLGLVIFSPHPWLGAVSVLFWGLGASLGFPLALSAAAEGPAEHSVRNVSAAATLGYVAFLVGPPALGFLGERYGLRMAMLPVLVMVAVAVVLAPAFRSQPQPACKR